MNPECARTQRLRLSPGNAQHPLTDGEAYNFARTEIPQRQSVRATRALQMNRPLAPFAQPSQIRIFRRAKIRRAGAQERDPLFQVGLVGSRALVPANPICLMQLFYAHDIILNTWDE